MAWDVKYYCEFTDDLGVDWLVNFEQDGSFTPTELQASGDPLFIEWIGEDDIQETNVMGSRMSLTVEALSDFAFSDLFSSDNLATRVTVYHGVTEYWHGFILPNTWQEPYDGVPYSVTIEATDGLGLLSDYKFKDLGYSARQTLAKVIHDILALVQIDTFTEYVNIYESTMDDTTGDSPILQCGMDPDLFKEEDCYTALSEILKSLNAGIRQDNGTFEIFRFVELSASMHGRAYTDESTNSYVSKDPAQKINRPGDTSNLWDMNGGTRMIIPQAKTINVNHDYRFKGSVLKNYNFPYDEFAWDTDHFDIDGWTKGGSGYIQPISVVSANWLGFKRGSDQAEGMSMTNRLSSTLPDYYYQTVVVAAASVDKFVMELEVSLLSFDGSDDVGTFYIQIKSTDGVDTEYYYSGIGDWDTDERYIIEVANCTKDPTWKTYTYTIDEVPYAGDLTVTVYGGFDHVTSPGNIMIACKNLCIYWANSDGVVPEGTAYVVSNTVAGQIIDREYILGDGYGFDNDHLQYAGALNVWDGADIVPTSKSWHTRGATQNIPLIQLIGQEYGEQYERQKDLIDLPLYENTAATFLKINANLQDSYNVYSPGLNRIFAISRAMYDVRKREYQLSLTEIIQ